MLIALVIKTEVQRHLQSIQLQEKNNIDDSTPDSKSSESSLEINLISQKEMLAILKMSSSTLGRRRKDGLPYIKTGKKLLYEPEKVLKYIGGLRNGR
jgi:hypothetical protein